MQRNEPMAGHLPDYGLYGGFIPGMAPAAQGQSIPIITRGVDFSNLSDETRNQLAGIQRGEIVGDVNQVLTALGMQMADLERAITATTSALPVRENLEAEAKILVPVDTPIRNMLPRKLGSGLASLWRQITSLGGGWSGVDQPGSAAAIRAFFAETGAPADHATAYASKTAAYKLLGSYGSVTGLAIAGGANFQNQLAVEKTNGIRNLMLNEENAFVNGSSTSTAAPWGDGVNALGFDGFLNLIATANGTPANQVQTAVGALTTAAVDVMLGHLWNQGGRGIYMLLNQQEARSFVHLAEEAGSLIRVQATMDGQTVLGVKLNGYVDPVTGDLVPMMTSRFVPAGTIIYGSKELPDGTPGADVDVLPQVQLPELAPNVNIQGYTAQEIAPTTTAPQVYPFMVSVYEVMRMKSALHFGTMAGVTAV